MSDWTDGALADAGHGIASPPTSSDPASVPMPVSGVGLLDVASWSGLAFDRAPMGCLLTGLDGTIRLANRAFAVMLGYDSCELEGRHFSEFTDPRDLLASLAALERLLAGGADDVQVDKRYVHASGKKVWARTKVALVRDDSGNPAGFVAQSEDVSDRRAANLRLRRSEAFLHRIFDSSAVAMALLDKSGNALQVNRAMAALSGREAFELAGEQLLSYLLLPNQAVVRDICRSSRRDANFEAQISLPGGTAATVLCLMGPVTSPGGAPWMIVQMVDISGRKAAEEISTYRSLHDELTGLANRRRFVENLEAALSSQRSRRQKTAVLMIDLDRFKEVNNGLGHAAGDAILVEVARRLEAVTRRADTVGRIGGDEFWIVAGDVEDDIGAINLSIAVLRVLSQPFRIDDATVHVGASIGFCLSPDDGTAVQELMGRADAAQYRAKAAGSGWAAYSQGSDEQRLELLELAADLRSAIDSEELDIAYQPLFTAGGRIIGFEALSRWNHPERGPIPPDVFVPLAEHAKLMPALTRTVLRRSGRQCAQWRADGRDVSIAVNLAPSMLRDDFLVELITHELAESGLEAAHLTLEITEGKLADGFDPVISNALQGLHRLGVRLSIDDFGTGYSSLAYLKDLPVDELKIDKSFVAHLDVDGRDAAIVRSMVDLAKILQLDVVAEGVETQEVAASLLDAGCDIIQGFGLGRPRSARHATTLLSEQAAAEIKAERVQPKPSPSDRHLRIVLADNNARSKASLSRALGRASHHVDMADCGADVIAMIRDGQPDMVILSQVMAGDVSAVQTGTALRTSGYTGPIIILFTLGRQTGLRPRRFPIDVWPVAKDDRATLLHLVKGCAARHQHTA